MSELIIKDLHAQIEDKKIVKGLNLTIKQGEIHAIMGPNGSGKSTLANVIMGHPNYEVTQGEVLYKGENILEMEPDERAKLGVFLGFQYPSSVPGVSVSNFIRTVMNALKDDKSDKISLTKFNDKLSKSMEILHMDKSFATRYLNDGFSGGEKKRMEILQMLMFEPSFVILDEIDSGLDIDALRVVSAGVNALKSSERGFLIITHYQRILDYIKPDYVHIMKEGKIVKSGGHELALELEKSGYKEV